MPTAQAAVSVLVRPAAAGADLGAVHYGGASRQQGDALLNLFYPDHDNFWLGLLPGIPAVAAFISGRQRFPVSGS
jgi:hypothetical protein